MHPAQLSQNNVDKNKGYIQDNFFSPVGYPVKGRQGNDEEFIALFQGLFSMLATTSLTVFITCIASNTIATCKLGMHCTKFTGITAFMTWL